MLEWVNSVGIVLAENLPGLILSILVGFVLLAIEYRTGLFANHTPSVIAARESGKEVKRVGMSVKPVLETIGFILVILTFLTFFGALIYFNVERPNQTVLDNQEDPLVVLGTIKSGDTLSFFDNSLFVTVSRTNLQNEVWFVVGSPGYPDLVEEQKSIGYSFIYPAKDNYHIRVTSVSSGFSGTFVDFVVKKFEEGEVFITPTPLASPEED